MKETKFTADNNVLTVIREFDASIDLVWRAWTEADLLDQWWAPKPWRSRTKRMDFKAGGHRLYAMVGPQGEEHWGITVYRQIVPQDSFSGEDAFCNEEGIVNESLPVATFKNRFSGDVEKTTITVTTEYASEEQLEQVIKMGMKEGLSMAFENLDQLLKDLGS